MIKSIILFLKRKSLMLNTILLFGGVDDERLVSIASAKNLALSFDFDTYLFLDKNYLLYIVEKADLIQHDCDFISDFIIKDNYEHIGDVYNITLNVNKNSVFFLALHGKFGEDGEIQSILEKHKFKFTGSSSKSCTICFNKRLSKQIANENGIPTPKVISSSSDLILKEKAIISKPIKGGSSFGINFYNSISDIPNHILDNPNIICEEKINGREFSCGVIENNCSVTPLIPVEIVCNNHFGYEEKYISQDTKEIVNPKIDIEIKQLIQDFSLKIHKALNCTGYSRSDFIFDGINLFYLETNSLPGLSKQSILIKER